MCKRLDLWLAGISGSLNQWTLNLRASSLKCMNLYHEPQGRKVKNFQRLSVESADWHPVNRLVTWSEKNVWENSGVSVKSAAYLWPQKCNFVFLFLNIIIFFHFKLLERSSTIFHNLKIFHRRTETWKLISNQWLPGAQAELMNASGIEHLSSFWFDRLNNAVKIAGK